MKKNTQTDYTTGTPWLACDLEGTVTAETEASLKDHFALAVNKDKILEMEIPEANSRTTISPSIPTVTMILQKPRRMSQFRF